MFSRLRRGKEGEQFNQWALEYGPVYSFRYLFSKATVLSGITEIEQVLKARPHDFIRRFRVKRSFDGIGAHGLFSAEGEEWRELRRLTAPAFNDKKVNEQAAPIIEEAVREMMEKWRAQGSNRVPNLVCTVQEDLNKLTLDVICRLTLGRDLGFQKGSNDAVQEDIRVAIEKDLPQLLRDRAPWGKIWPFKKIWRIYDEITTRAGRNSRMLADCILRRKMAIASGHDTIPEDLLQTLVQHFTLSGAPTLSGSLKGNLLTFLTAGSETTGGTASYLLWYLARYPTVQDKLRQELAAGSGSVLDKTKFPYLHACVMEVLRLRPAAYTLLLETARPGVLLCGSPLPKGSVIVCNLYGAMVLTYGSEFQPDQWLDPSSAIYKDLLKGTDLLSFGFGPRVCVGRQLAIAELAIMLAAIVTHFQLQLPDEESLHLAQHPRSIFRLTMKPEDDSIRLVLVPVT
ncbi:cytochrome P450, putative [Perkinsus marinus ATCC 50983]|uniref:Cytochrome P450, putative n=1 Tax=Perkinsus marinus (strain ATCC 50983 / TXsc) TaxID=423536 RepID=C5LI70_PERM5|nr:cytochrome P450, putative [Perkinsus marinus ATCC 50983]EER03605.1 cytochrome P450, putative [Perkinsus marinus ATCC 50983]|eukprot:XP_002771789.1 cytochrome P450, putative [Perkinsus marinus ATCC 50983]